MATDDQVLATVRGRAQFVSDNLLAIEPDQRTALQAGLGCHAHQKGSRSPSSTSALPATIVEIRPKRWMDSSDALRSLTTTSLLCLSVTNRLSRL